jgi:hypothetical protein
MVDERCLTVDRRAIPANARLPSTLEQKVGEVISREVVSGQFSRWMHEIVDDPPQTPYVGLEDRGRRRQLDQICCGLRLSIFSQ